MIITGLARLGSDTTIRFIPSGEAVANLSLAFNYGRKGADGKQPTQWIEASLWGKRAEALQQYLTKGTMVSVVLAEPHIETYTTRDGREGSKLAARVLEIEFAGGKRQDTQPTDAPGTATAPSAASGINDMTDDTPF
jgi:single-strand DNA-binding protein